MKKLFFLFIGLFFSFQNLQANGICIIDLDNEVYLPLTTSDIHVSINNQIATIKITQSFLNNTGGDTNIKYAFPMSETSSALSLRWENNNEWFSADFSASPQDTIIPGNPSGVSNGPVSQYLGDNPLYFNLEQDVANEGIITFELTYVDLLPYEFGVVDFFYKNNLSEIQSSPLDYFNLEVDLFSDRTIDWLEMTDFNTASVTNNGNEATLNFYQNNFYPDQDITVQYQLNAEELGLFSFSTFISDTLLHCDEDGEGFMAFIVEPDPSENTETIDKVFTLIIDESGSMSGSKMAQARDAASFITNNLNEGDEFNIISFDSNIYSFMPTHVPFNLTTQAQAIEFISNIGASGSTNISGAFSEAIPDFQNSDPDKAKIIIFFTDGEATQGITSTQGILDHISNLINIYEVNDLSIFTFGIGSGANQQLLTLIALQNNGLAEFLGNEELSSAISDFYLTIQNPVLLNTEMFFNPDLVIETYPNPLPNLFKGQQLIVVGRYHEANDVSVNFSGTAFGEVVSYDYDISLASEIDTALQFLPRLWAKRKIENLYIEYFSQTPNSPEAQILEDSITNISLCYGVISPFTSFEDNSGGAAVSIFEFDNIDAEYIDIQSTPNPFHEEISLSFTISESLKNKPFSIEITDINGRVIYKNELLANNQSVQQFIWDGKRYDGNNSPAGIYFVRIMIEDVTYLTKIIKGM